MKISAKVKYLTVFVVVVGLISFFYHHKAALLAEQQCVAAGTIPVKYGKLSYEIFGKKGTPIIVAHGGPGLGYGYLLPQMLELAKDHQVIFYDQQGAGKSVNGKVNPEGINMPQFVADLESLRSALGWQKVILLGHSWGGLLAMNYAIKFPQHLESLVLMNSAPATSKGWHAFIQQYLATNAPVQERLAAIQAMPKFVDGDPKLVKKFLKISLARYFVKMADVEKLSLNFTNASAQAFLQTASLLNNGYLAEPYDLTTELQQLAVPTLVVHGAHDLIPLWTAEEIAHAIAKSKLRVIKDSGHFPFIEKPTELFRDLRWFWHDLITAK